MKVARLILPAHDGPEAAAHYLAALAWPGSREKREGFIAASAFMWTSDLDASERPAMTQGTKPNRHRGTFHSGSRRALRRASRQVGIEAIRFNPTHDGLPPLAMKETCYQLIDHCEQIRSDPIPLNASRLEPHKDVAKRTWRVRLPAHALAHGFIMIVRDAWAAGEFSRQWVHRGEWVPEAVELAQLRAPFIAVQYRPKRIIVPGFHGREIGPIKRAIRNALEIPN